MKQYRIAFVVPRYGEDIAGGAETLTRAVAEALATAGIAEVTVLTTCARNHITWENEVAPGETELNGVTIHRFLIDKRVRNPRRYEDLHIRLIGREILSLDEQYEWIDQSAHSPQMYAHLENSGSAYDFIIFIPYLFGTTYYGTAIHPERSILWPCLHDEIYAYLQPTVEMYRSCLGVAFNSFPEKRLAQRLYGHHPGGQVIGMGVDDITADANRFRQKHNLQDPFLLYVGRLEGAKNVPLLLQHFIEYKQRNQNQWKLVLMGRGPESIPIHSDILSLGYCPDQEKLDAHAAATLFCQPSTNESFSIVLMESWLREVPVLVHSDCEVTRYHVVRSNGGLYFRTYDEFETILDLLFNDDDLYHSLGRNGRQYVRQQYDWQAVLGRLTEAFAMWDKLRSCNY
jgi:glycosyltransferase involved in cell wall biosynthesis